MKPELPKVRDRARSGPLIGVIAGAALLVVGPLVGFATTAFLLQRAFGDVAKVDPSEKARLLAEGISDAMNFAAAGLVIGVLGAVAFIVSLIILLRRKGDSQHRAPNSQDPP